MKPYSNSKISTFEQCPQQYKFAYIDRIKTDIDETVETFMGSRVHDTLEFLYREIMNGIVPELQKLHEFYNEEWNTKWSHKILIVRNNMTALDYRQKGEMFITNYYERFHPFDQNTTIALETTQIVPLNDTYGIHIRIDRLAKTDDNTYEIHDYKTGSRLPTQQKVDEDRQLTIYAYGLKKLYPDAKNIKLIWHFLAHDKSLISERSEAQIHKIEQDLLESIRIIEAAQAFPTNKSMLCNWCRFKPICPAWTGQQTLSGF